MAIGLHLVQYNQESPRAPDFPSTFFNFWKQYILIEKQRYSLTI